MFYIIAGPPGSGKTTYARNHLKDGDVIIDLDMIYQAFSGLPMYKKPDNLLSFMLDVQRFAIQRSITDEKTINSIWIIISGARRDEREQLSRRLNAEVVVLDVDASVCLRRIESDPLRFGSGIPWGMLVKKWWAEYECA